MNFDNCLHGLILKADPWGQVPGELWVFYSACPYGSGCWSRFN